MENRQANQQSRCFALTCNELLDVPRLKERFEIAREEFSTSHGDNSIVLYRHAENWFSFVFQVFTRKPNPHERIETFCFGQGKTGAAFALGEMLQFRFEIQPTNYKGKRGLEADILHGFAVGAEKLFVPSAVIERLLGKLENI